MFNKGHGIILKYIRMGGEGNGTPLQYSCLETPMDRGAWWATVHGVATSRTRLSDFTFTFHFHALEKEMATHSSILAWRIPGTEEPGGLLSMGSHRVGHDWSDWAAAEAAAACKNESFSISPSVIYLSTQGYTAQSGTLGRSWCLLYSHSFEILMNQCLCIFYYALEICTADDNACRWSAMGLPYKVELIHLSNSQGLVTPQKELKLNLEPRRINSIFPIDIISFTITPVERYLAKWLSIKLSEAHFVGGKKWLVSEITCPNQGVMLKSPSFLGSWVWRSLSHAQLEPLRQKLIAMELHLSLSLVLGRAAHPPSADFHLKHKASLVSESVIS